MDELTALPATFAAGTTVVYRRSYSDYPASAGWALTLYLKGESAISAVAAADGDDHVITLTAAVTAPIKPGTYRWVEQATKGALAYGASGGFAVVTMNLVTAAAGDAQSNDEKELVAIRALLAGRYVNDVEAFQINGRSIQHAPREVLQARERELKRNIARRLRGGGVFAGVVRTRAVRPGGG